MDDSTVLSIEECSIQSCIISPETEQDSLLFVTPETTATFTRTQELPVFSEFISPELGEEPFVYNDITLHSTPALHV